MKKKKKKISIRRRLKILLRSVSENARERDNFFKLERVITPTLIHNRVI